MAILIQCVCGATTPDNNTTGWNRLETMNPTLNREESRYDYDTRHLCPTCSLAVRQIAQDTQDDNQED